MTRIAMSPRKSVAGGDFGNPMGTLSVTRANSESESESETEAGAVTGLPGAKPLREAFALSRPRSRGRPVHERSAKRGGAR